MIIISASHLKQYCKGIASSGLHFFEAGAVDHVNQGNGGERDNDSETFGGNSR